MVWHNINIIKSHKSKQWTGVEDLHKTHGNVEKRELSKSSTSDCLRRSHASGHIKVWLEKAVASSYNTVLTIDPQYSNYDNGHSSFIPAIFISKLNASWGETSNLSSY